MNFQIHSHIGTLRTNFDLAKRTIWFWKPLSERWFRIQVLPTFIHNKLPIKTTISKKCKSDIITSFIILQFNSFQSPNKIINAIDMTFTVVNRKKSQAYSRETRLVLIAQRFFGKNNSVDTSLKWISQAFSSVSNSSGCKESFSISSWKTNLSSEGSVFDITEYLMLSPDPNSLLGHIFNPEIIFIKLWPADFESTLWARVQRRPKNRPTNRLNGLGWIEADESFPGRKSFLD